MIVVLDTNVLVSGLLNPYGAPGKIIQLITTADISLAYDNRILLEYHQVLARPKFQFNPIEVAALIDLIETTGSLTIPKPLPHPLPDPDDEPFLEVAIESQSSYLITGNLKHFPSEISQGTAVVNPNEFLEAKKGPRLTD